MKNMLKTGAILSSLTLLGFILLTSFNNLDEDIIGSWILENDTDSKWVFTNEYCYWYNFRM
ncbi:MAG: hypothetical protein ED556_11205 [Winogradskyella sp.]|uniref:hypothetical protein n=1 Tax=Winogradskyella sp. TaxID=1883156 RepID=UPI000F3E8C55|nr:hypothetical protein [Winogradskyella sp.]RNC85126.1 MAG: hypothetical protein ED556_11205 [Winogradskyella sp.]